jgi:hypothetical protein
MLENTSKNKQKKRVLFPSIIHLLIIIVKNNAKVNIQEAVEQKNGNLLFTLTCFILKNTFLFLLEQVVLYYLHRAAKIK